MPLDHINHHSLTFKLIISIEYLPVLCVSKQGQDKSPLCYERTERLTDPRDHRAGLRNRAWIRIGIPSSPGTGHQASPSQEKSAKHTHLSSDVSPIKPELQSMVCEMHGCLGLLPTPYYILYSLFSNSQHKMLWKRIFTVKVQYFNQPLLPPEFISLQKGIDHPSTIQKQSHQGYEVLLNEELKKYFRGDGLPGACKQDCWLGLEIKMSSNPVETTLH